MVRLDAHRAAENVPARLRSRSVLVAREWGLSGADSWSDGLETHRGLAGGLLAYACVLAMGSVFVFYARTIVFDAAFTLLVSCSEARRRFKSTRTDH